MRATATPEQIAELEREWRAEGRPEEEIGARIAAMVAREAERAEAGEATDPDTEAVEGAEAPENGGEAPAEPEAQELSGDALLKAAEAWPLCPACQGLGKIPPELQQSKTEGTCPDCAGMGLVLTGSLKEEAATLTCARCNGNGYVQIPPPENSGSEVHPNYERRW